MWSQNLPDTQNARDDIYSQENENPNVWGRLYATKEKFISLDLSDNEYTIGRAQDCSITISYLEVREDVLQTISKQHCRIVRTEVSSGTPEVYLEDYSSNGTYVNSEKIGKGNKRILKNNDHISLASPQFKVYVYVDASDDGRNFPEEIRSEYIVTKELGAGACGKVYLVFEKKTCNRYAMKVVQKKRFNSIKGQNRNNPDKTLNEVNILRALKHPCIIRVEHIVDAPDAVYIILELMEGGELFDRIQCSKQLNESETKLIFYQIVQAIKYLHDNKITHRDLKPENILLASEKRETLVKVSDFGLSKFVNSQSIMKTFCGTPLYVAPEVLVTKGMGSYTTQVDIWSLGVILFTCLSGYPPFSAEYRPLSLVEQIMNGAYSFPARYWQGVSNNAIDLIRKMLTVDPSSRITIDEILCHRWLQDKKLEKTFKELTKHAHQDDERSPPQRRRRLDGEDTH
ncbi:serine/threonine-protein kinase Chk2 [Zootermopsis nevadensis]|uniref:Serine/threonine-protein kinase Chk2 n=1 Tax=Zootermopsis nevadensis TaxID=136037 RepID=A0A067QEX6_ZOONE|nr:serine/threonine-protein kinase Chk2 [Zootermopsis nevadensis]KDQ97283.1 Serine/threonine-protein kinase Chk2 [Zootermopsis nevadensis]